MNRFIVIDFEKNDLYSINDLKCLISEDNIDDFGCGISFNDKNELIEETIKWLNEEKGEDYE